MRWIVLSNDEKSVRPLLRMALEEACYDLPEAVTAGTAVALCAMLRSERLYT